MITVEQALKIVARETQALKAERIPLEDALGCVLAEDIIADTDMPPFDRSQMDGYAVKAADTENAPVSLNLVGESAAGRGWHKTLKAGEAVRIMTGAPLPQGADAVQKIELTREDGDSVMIEEPTFPGRYIVHQGKEIKKGKVVLKSGTTITPNNIAVPAAFGYAKLRVAKRPHVAVLSTGTEIVDVAKRPKRDQIRNSNSIMLKALCERAGAEATILPHVGDDISDLRSQISYAASSADILITTGGVSVGKYDLTKLALRELGAEIFFERLRLKPGKPTVFAKLKKTLIFGLPGNPVSAAVTYYLFVRSALMRMQNAETPNLKKGTAITSKPAKAPKERDAYLPASLSTDANGSLVAEPLDWHGSSDFIGFARTDALLVVKRGTKIESGSPVQLLFL
jgi:molybdenum cofactor synthesis domain-containing protein